MVAEPSLASLQLPGIVRTELLTPLSNRLIRHDDSALGEKIFDIAKAHAEAMISPDRIADDLARETIAGVRRRIAFHGTSFSGFPELTMRFRAFDSACRTIQGIETVNMIRKGQVRWIAKDDIFGQVTFIVGLFGVTIAA